MESKLAGLFDLPEDFLDEGISGTSDGNIFFAANATPEDKLATLTLPGRNTNLGGKERNRLIVKRYYYRKITTLKGLRAEVEYLEAHYRQLLLQEHLATARPSSGDDFDPKTDLEERIDAYMELALLSDVLRLENEQLHRSCNEVEKLQKQLTQLYLAQCRNVERKHAEIESRKQNPTIDFRELSSLECAEITTDLCDRIIAFRENSEGLMCGADVFGWHDRHCYENGNLSFSLEKTFQRQTFESVSDKMWQLVNDSNAFAQLYPTSLHPTFHELQRLDDNNFVSLHTLQVGKQAEFRNKSVMLCSRLSVLDGDGCLVVLRSLNPRKYVKSKDDALQRPERRGRQKIEPQVEEVWTNSFIWSLFRRSGADGEDCVTEFGGTLFQTASSWRMIERLQFAIKFEQHILGPLDLLHTADSPDTFHSMVKDNHAEIRSQADS